MYAESLPHGSQAPVPGSVLMGTSLHQAARPLPRRGGEGGGVCAQFPRSRLPPGAALAFLLLFTPGLPGTREGPVLRGPGPSSRGSRSLPLSFCPRLAPLSQRQKLPPDPSGAGGLTSPTPTTLQGPWLEIPGGTAPSSCCVPLAPPGHSLSGWGSGLNLTMINKTTEEKWPTQCIV